jgi:vitamin B12 transporter
MKHVSALLAAFAASASVAPSFADSNEVPDDQIIVTGSRTPISAADIGSAVTIITRDDIERRQSRYVSDLLRSVPGFAVSHSGVVGSQTQVRVRGSEANHVLVLIDGARANDPATGDEFRWEYLSSSNIERIEIVRGPQSALWGSDAIGGVVHIITRSEDSSGVDGYLEGGSWNTLNGAINGTIGGDAWSTGFGFEQLTTDGSNISRTGDENDDAEITTASFNVHFDPTNVVSIRLGARSVDAYSQFDAVDFVTTGLPADSDVATDSTQHTVNLGATFGATDSRLRHRLSARFFDSHNRNLLDGIEDSSSASERLTFGYQADIALGDNMLALALEHEDTQFEQRGAVDWGDPNQDQEMDVTSVIADFQGRSIEDITWLLSARLDKNSDFDDIVTGRASIAWDVAGETSLSANIGTGQKAPTFIERYGYFPGQFVGNPDLKPEQSVSYDFGIEQRIASSASIQIAVFRQTVEDEIDGFVFDPESGLFTARNLDTTSKRSGVEVGARWTVSELLDLSMNYTYTDSTENGASELRRPRHAGNASIDANFLEGRARLMLVADYGGTRHDIYFPPWPEPSEIVALDSYWLLDLTAQYQATDSIKLFVRASNLLDADYEQVYGYNTPGRAWYGGVRVHFGN